MKTYSIATLLLVFSVAFAKGTDNPRAFFGENYTLSLALLKNMQPELAKTIRAFNLNPTEIYAIVFPELIRYNRFMNYIEVSALEISYCKLGSKEIDFSIGYFQMKTSFAEKVEALVLQGCLPDVYNRLLISTLITEEKQRAERLKRLNTYQWQISYVCAYVQYYLQKYPSLNSSSAKQRIEFLATAYNTTFNADSATIIGRISNKSFPFGTKFENPFAYAEVSLFFYDNESL